MIIWYMVMLSYKPEAWKNGWHFADDIFEVYFSIIFCILKQIWLKIVPKGLFIQHHRNQCRSSWHYIPYPKIQSDKKVLARFECLGQHIYDSKSTSTPQCHGHHMTVCYSIDLDDVIKWKHFPRYWPFVRGIHRSPVPGKRSVKWRGALMFSLICVWINVE